MRKILLVEDDLRLSEGIALALRHTELQVTRSHSLASALEELGTQSFDLLLLDINLPDGSGMDLLREVKKSFAMPVILLTANDTEMDVVLGLESGADDYITKPFSLAVLRARVNARLRDAANTAAEVALEAYRFNFEKMEFFHAEQMVELSKTEQKLLRLLVENRGNTIPRDTLLERVWGDGMEFVDENTLSVAVKRLRDKLDAADYIKTVYGIGYGWAVQ